MRYLIASLLALSLLSAAENKLGKPLTVKEPMTLAALLAHPDDYVGKTVQVQGKIVEVCQEMGCWLDLTNEAGQKLHVKVNDGEIVFPKDSPGKSVVAEGKFIKIDSAGAKGATAVYQLQGSGAVIN